MKINLINPCLNLNPCSYKQAQNITYLCKGNYQKHMKVLKSANYIQDRLSKVMAEQIIKCLKNNDELNIVDVVNYIKLSAKALVCLSVAT